MADLDAWLQERRHRRRARRIGVAVACVAILVVGGLWFNRTKPQMTCDEWRTEYAAAVAHNAGGTVANLDRIRPEGCQAPVVPLS